MSNSEIPKPWTETVHAKNIEEMTTLRDTRSFLYAQIVAIDERLRALNADILTGVLNKMSDPPKDPYKREIPDSPQPELPLVYTNFPPGLVDEELKTSRFRVRGIIRNFRGNP